MTFGKWLTVGLEVAFFIMGMTCFFVLKNPETLAITGAGMGLIGVFYALCYDVNKG